MAQAKEFTHPNGHVAEIFPITVRTKDLAAIEVFKETGIEISFQQDVTKVPGRPLWMGKIANKACKSLRLVEDGALQGKLDDGARKQLIENQPGLFNWIYEKGTEYQDELGKTFEVAAGN